MSTRGQKLTAAQRKAVVLRMRMQGYTYQEIADSDAGVKKSRAQQIVRQAMDEAATEAKDSRDAYMGMELERLDYAQRQIWGQVKSGNLKAVDRLLKIIQQRARLLGLDAPTKLAATDPEGEEASGLVLLPATANSVEEWLAEHRPKGDQDADQ